MAAADSRGPSRVSVACVDVRWLVPAFGTPPAPLTVGVPGAQRLRVWATRAAVAADTLRRCGSRSGPHVQGPAYSSIPGHAIASSTLLAKWNARPSASLVIGPRKKPRWMLCAPIM